MTLFWIPAASSISCICLALRKESLWCLIWNVSVLSLSENPDERSHAWHTIALSSWWWRDFHTSICFVRKRILQKKRVRWRLSRLERSYGKFILWTCHASACLLFWLKWRQVVQRKKKMPGIESDYQTVSVKDPRLFWKTSRIQASSDSSPRVIRADQQGS